MNTRCSALELVDQKTWIKKRIYLHCCQAGTASTQYIMCCMILKYNPEKLTTN